MSADDLPLDLTSAELAQLLDDPDLERLFGELEELGVDLTDPAPLDRAPSPHASLAEALTLVRQTPPDQAMPNLAPQMARDLATPWVDPSDMPFTPQPRPGKSLPSRIFSMMLTWVFMAAIAWLIVPELDLRFLHQGELRYRDGILTAQPIPLSSMYPSVVEELYVDYVTLDDEMLPAGTPVALLRRMGPDGVTEETEELVVPIDSRFASVDAPEGSVIYPGQPVVTVYDPTLMSVLVTINAGDLEDLRRGMSVRLTNEAVSGALHGTVDSAVPLLGTDHEPTSSRLVNIRVRPNPGEVTDLVPGIRFRVVVDTESVDDEAPELVFTGSTVVADDTDDAGAGDTDEAGADEAAADEAAGVDEG